METATETAGRVASNTEFVARFNAATAEAGYPSVRLRVGEYDNLFGDIAVYPPPVIIWTALYLARQGEPMPCWACWEASNRAASAFSDPEGKTRWASDCVMNRRGGCHFPSGPAFPPRSLLTSAKGDFHAKED